MTTRTQHSKALVLSRSEVDAALDTTSFQAARRAQYGKPQTSPLAQQVLQGESIADHIPDLLMDGRMLWDFISTLVDCYGSMAKKVKSIGLDDFHRNILNTLAALPEGPFFYTLREVITRARPAHMALNMHMAAALVELSWNKTAPGNKPLLVVLEKLECLGAYALLDAEYEGHTIVATQEKIYGTALECLEKGTTHLYSALDNIMRIAEESGVILQADEGEDQIGLINIERFGSQAGAGLTALQMLLRYADRVGKAVELCVLVGNDTLVRYYEQQGFTVLASTEDPETGDVSMHRPPQHLPSNDISYQ